MSEDNGLVKLVDIPNKGRSFISSRPLKAGEIVLRDTPILLYSAAQADAGGGSSAVYCSHCFRTIPQNSPISVSCPNCAKYSIFCSQQCLSIAQSTSHTPFVCSALIHLRNSPHQNQPHERLIQARFLISAYNLATMSPSDFGTLLSLQGEPVIDDVVVLLHSIISSICDVRQYNVEITAALLAKDRINAFGIMETSVEGMERSVRAYGIYPRASFFNHDCLPNACRFDYVDSNCDGIGNGSNVDIIVRIIHDVPEGREICLSYFPVNFEYKERQKRLKEDYGFMCDCDRCRVEANWSDYDYDDDDDDDEGEMDQDSEDNMDEDNNGDAMGDVIDNDECQMENEKQSDDFPHAYFFVRYMCKGDNCGGTLAPLAPVNGRASNVVECNACGNLSKSENIEGN